MRPHVVSLILLLALCQEGQAAIDDWQPIVVDRPLRDPSITTCADGSYLLSGTVGQQDNEGTITWANNEGVVVWHSMDLSTWKSLGPVWRFSKANADRKNAWGWTYQQQVTGPARGDLGHAATGVVVHQQGDRWYLSYAINHLHNGLLVAKEPQGPYEPLAGRFHSDKARFGDTPTRSNRHSPHSFFLMGDAGLFTHNTGSWWVWGSGWIAPLSEDLQQWQAHPIDLQSRISGWPNPAGPTYSRPSGAQLVAIDGRIVFLFAAWQVRAGTAHHDTFISLADDLAGPFSAPRLLIPDGAQAHAFQTPAGWRIAALHDQAPASARFSITDLP